MKIVIDVSNEEKAKHLQETLYNGLRGIIYISVGS